MTTIYLKSSPNGVRRHVHRLFGAGYPVPGEDNFRIMIVIAKIQSLRCWVNNYDPTTQGKRNKFIQFPSILWSKRESVIPQAVSDSDLHRRLLYSSRDGRGLAGVAEASTNSHDWLRGCTALFNGRDFIDSLKLRGNLLATGERKLRGRGTPPCSVGCRVGDSLGHWLQGCPEGRHLRVARHDKLVNYVASQLVGKGHRVAVEPAIPTPAGMRKPDLVIETRDGSTHVVDVQIVADSAVTSLKAAHERKVAYYYTPPVLEWVDRWRQSTSPRPDLRAEVGSLTISWRGYLVADSSLTMRKLNLGSYQQGIMIVKAMQGSLAIARSRLRRGLRRQPFG
ncbi:Retrovirus-related Pol polyprotein from type-2 retrotransposable element R2DM [Armadillidium vulgare]|nr:Retrovirus-related Pol polyprotein from type-2 retrotransposable element R2DM [Armadillidium vulgare]